MHLNCDRLFPFQGGDIAKLRLKLGTLVGLAGRGQDPNFFLYDYRIRVTTEFGVHMDVTG